MKIEPYLFFNGRCDEAIAFYREVFGAETTMLMRFHENPEPPQCPLPDGWEDKVMHAALRIGETNVMMSDGGCADPAAHFDGFGLSVAMPDSDAVERAFAALEDGGKVVMPLGKTFFSPCFGMVADRFGVCWMLIVPE